MVSVLIVNFNSTPLLRLALDAVARSSVFDRLETIVVDNASTDFDIEDLSGSYPWVKWLPQNENTTCTGGNNLAFSASTAPYVLMLNPDTEPAADAIEIALMELQKSRGTVAVGAAFVNENGNLQRIYRRLPRPADIPLLLFERAFRHTERGRRFLMLDVDFREPTPVEHCPGVFLLIRREVLGAFLLHPGYFNLLSDLELSRRLNQRGTVLVVPNVRCSHVGGGGGLGTADVQWRIRLHQDLVWGVRRYFEDSPAWVRAWLTAMVTAYWVARVLHMAIGRPSALAPASIGAVRSVIGQPPDY